MGKKVVIRQDTTYMPSTVYGFELVEETALQKAGTSKSEAVKRSFDSGILHPLLMLLSLSIPNKVSETEFTIRSRISIWGTWNMRRRLLMQ